MITTLAEAQYEVQVVREEYEADMGEDVEIDHADVVASVCWNIDDLDLARELCRVEIGWIPRDLEGRLGKRDWVQ
jgi:hypothetical protein